MADKTVKVVRNGAKHGSELVEGRLRVQVGNRLLKVPGTVRILEGGSHVFLTIPMSTGVYRVVGRDLVQMPDDAPASAELVADLSRRGRPRGVKGKAVRASISPELLAQIEAAIPQGYKLVVKGGQPALARVRGPRVKK